MRLLQILKGVAFYSIFFRNFGMLHFSAKNI